MTTTQNLFLSCVDSQIQDNGSMYARFHIGTFYRGQSLTFANALRRSLLSEIPGFCITDVVIDGAEHEFATLPGVQETIFEIILNLKKLVFTPVTTNLSELKNFQTQIFLKSCGPGMLTGSDLRLPSTLKCITPNALIATLSLTGQLALYLELKFLPTNLSSFTSRTESLFSSETPIKKFSLEDAPMPVQKVNYIIKQIDAKTSSEFVILEIWTDGSILPQTCLQFAVKNLTEFFYQFVKLSTRNSDSLIDTNSFRISKTKDQKI